MIRTPIDLRGKRVVLLLQGGGALGAYQVGAYEVLDKALKDAGKTGVDWVAGISIGAVNAAVIASPRNTNHDALAALTSLWNDILSPPYPPYDSIQTLQGIPFHFSWLQPLVAKYWNWTFEAFGPLGQRNFFTPRPVWLPWSLQWFRPLNVEELGLYDTAPLRRTLDKHVDWNRFNEAGKKQRTRLSLGATSVETGELQLLDSFAPSATTQPYGNFIPVKMNADCVLASGALPPAFPPVKIGDDAYFDGGVSSNTLITELQRELTAEKTIVFLIDLWDRKGSIPRTMDEVAWRQKCIQFGSRKQAAESVVERHQLRAQYDRKHEPRTKLEVCQVMFESDDASQFALSDADFSPETFERMRKQGRLDMGRMLEKPNQVEIEGAALPITNPHSYAVLYRVGSLNKHLTTDKHIAA
jgi:NTE family protein